MLKKITLLLCALSCSSFSLAMEGGNSSLALSNQAGVPVKVGGYTTYGGAVIGNLKQNSTPQKKVKKPVDYYPSSTEFLQKAADQELRKRDLVAQQVSDKLNVNYVGIGDRWSLIRHTLVAMNAHTCLHESPENIVAELNQLGDRLALDGLVITRVRAINRRFDSLLKTLALQKTWGYYMFRVETSCARSNGCCLRHWDLDPFFDAQVPHGELNPFLQQHVQTEAENKYKKYFHLPDECNIREHALRKSAEYAINRVDAIAYLKALLETKTLKNLPPKIKNELKKEMCSKLESLCAHDAITYKEGKYCDGDEFKQECSTRS